MIFTSSTARLSLPADLRTDVVGAASPGDVVVVEMLGVNPAYPHVELPDGSFATPVVGDLLVGALGSRQALRGFVGRAPLSVEAGETLSLLNMGGVIGRFVDTTTALGEPACVRYLGTVVDEQGIVTMRRGALPTATAIERDRPVVLVVGTCMSVGKTTTVRHLIETATKAGHRVGAAKLSGVAALRDLRAFEAAGAVDVKSFLDCGLPSTVDSDDLAPVVKTVINALGGDLLVVELGDGIMGGYHVETVFADAAIMRNVASVVVCAGDICGAYGAKLYLERYGVAVDAFSGLATENVAGTAYIEEALGIPAINAVKEPERLFGALSLLREAAAA